MSSLNPSWGIDTSASAALVMPPPNALSSAAERNAHGPAPVTPTRTWSPKSATITPTMAYRDAGFGNFA